MKKPIKVAISQRICPDWRVPVFRELANRKGIDLTLFFGKGLPSGANRNAENIKGFKYKKLFTIAIQLNGRGVEKYRVFHPTLLFYLLLGNYDVVITEPSTNFFNNILIFPLCKIFGKKFIWYEAGFPDRPSLYRWIMGPFLNIMINKSDSCITYNSRADWDLINIGIDQKKIFRAQNTLDEKQLKKDVSKFAKKANKLKKDLGLGSSKVVLFIGGIEKRKRIKNIISATLMLRDKNLDIKVLIVGDGTYESKLRKGLTEIEKKFTIFAGRHVDDAVLYILASDIVVLPGQGGLSINHGFACSKPVIATPEAVAGGTTVYDYIKDGKNGYVVGINDVIALANKINLVLSDADHYSMLCQGALFSSKKLSVEKMVDGMGNAIRYAAKSKEKSES